MEGRYHRGPPWPRCHAHTHPCGHVGEQISAQWCICMMRRNSSCWGVREGLYSKWTGKDCLPLPYHDEAATIRRTGRARCARRGEVNDVGHGQPPPTSMYKHRGMKAVKASAFVGRVDVGSGSAKVLETSLQQLLLLLPPFPGAAGAALPAAASHLPRSTLAVLLSQGLDASAIPAVRLLTYRVLAQGKALAPHVFAAPDLVERLVACVLSELGKGTEEEEKYDGNDDGDDDAEEGAEEGCLKKNGDVGVWAIRALLSTVTDTHLVVLLRYVKFICMYACVRDLACTPIHSILLVSFPISGSPGPDKTLSFPSCHFHIYCLHTTQRYRLPRRPEACALSFQPTMSASGNGPPEPWRGFASACGWRGHPVPLPSGGPLPIPGRRDTLPARGERRYHGHAQTLL